MDDNFDFYDLEEEYSTVNDGIQYYDNIQDDVDHAMVQDDVDDFPLQYEYEMGDMELIYNIRTKNYTGVIQEIRSAPERVANMSFNLDSLDYPSVIMTGLEYAVYRGDWKMAALFFSFGADPINNAFYGSVFWPGITCAEIIPGFDGYPIPGFDGLNYLISEDNDEQKNLRATAYLWLMKALHHVDTIPIHRNLRKFRDTIDVISEDLQFSGNNFRDLVWNTLLCMRKVGIPNDVAIRVAEEAGSATLWMLLKDYGLRGCNGGD